MFNEPTTHHVHSDMRLRYESISHLVLTDVCLRCGQDSLPGPAWLLSLLSLFFVFSSPLFSLLLFISVSFFILFARSTCCTSG